MWNGVSILVFLEPLLRHHSGWMGDMRRGVSILVFLEPLLRLEGIYYWEDCQESFNPCFSGTTA